MTEDMCAFCGGPKSLRNPSGACDHLYWPDLLTEEAKRANGLVPVQTDDLIERQQKAIDLLLDALDNLQVQGVNNGSWVMIPSVEWDSIFRAARSAKEQAEKILKGEGS